MLVHGRRGYAIAHSDMLARVLGLRHTLVGPATDAIPAGYPVPYGSLDADSLTDEVEAGSEWHQLWDHLMTDAWWHFPRANAADMQAGYQRLLDTLALYPHLSELFTTNLSGINPWWWTGKRLVTARIRETHRELRAALEMTGTMRPGRPPEQLPTLYVIEAAHDYFRVTRDERVAISAVTNLGDVSALAQAMSQIL